MIIKQGIPIIPALERLKQEVSKFEATLDSIGNLKLAWTA